MSMSSADANQSGDTSSTHPPLVYFRLPQLGMVHIVAWMAITAALLIWSSVAEHRWGGGISPLWLDVPRRLSELVGFAITAAQIVGVAVILRAKNRGESGRLQPGHWFLLLQAMMTLAHWLYWGVGRLRWSADFADPLTFWRYPILVAVGLANAVALLIVANWMQDSRHWRVAARVWGAVNLLYWSLAALLCVGVMTWFMSVSPMSPTPPIGEVVVLAVFLVALRIDIRRGPDRDWLHWSGVSIVIADNLVGVVRWGMQMIVLHQLAAY